MAKASQYPKRLKVWFSKRATAIWTNLQTDHLWQRMLKNTFATTITIIIALIPSVVAVYGKAGYLAPMVSVFGHPGRRFGVMAEALVLIMTGTLLGLGLSCLGLYLSSLAYELDEPAAYTIRGVFLVFCLMLHGFLRSLSPRLFNLVLLLIIISVVTLSGTATAVTTSTVTMMIYPIFTAIGVLVITNLFIFPEFSSAFLGTTTIETLGETVGALRDAGRYFVAVAEGPQKDVRTGIGTDEDTKDSNVEKTAAEKSDKTPKTNSTQGFVNRVQSFFQHENKTEDRKSEAAALKAVKLKSLTNAKAKLRTKLGSCKAAQQECNFELAWAVLPPRYLKPISDTQMKKLVANIIALIGACESKYALMGDEDHKREYKDEHENKYVEKGVNTGSGDDTSRPVSEADSSHDDSIDEKAAKRKKRKGRKRKSKTPLEQDIDNLKLIKPEKEIESGDIDLLKYLVSRIVKPLVDLQEKIDRSVDVVTSCLAYCYDVPKLPSGARAPSGIELQEIDIRIDVLTEALADFDKKSAAALESAASLHDHSQVDIMPRMETFLISSFLLNLRQAAFNVLEMLNHSRTLVEKRQARHGRKRIYLPRINWRKWLASGGEEDVLILPENARKGARTGKTGSRSQDDDDDSTTSKESLLTKKDVESAPENGEVSQLPRPSGSLKQAKKGKAGGIQTATFISHLRNTLADGIEYIAESEDFFYALKLTIAVFLVLWPALVGKWNAWYSLDRGLWAALQLIFIAEVAIGTSVTAFTLRAVGTSIGCVWGYAAYSAGSGNRVVCVIMMVIGIVPSTYMQLGTKHVKAGMVCVVSMSVVVLASQDHTVPGTAEENFLKRLIAFLIGAVVALIVEVAVFPVRARDRLVESLASSIGRIIEMETCVAYGIETGANLDVQSLAVTQRFEHAKSKAQGALTAAETFLPFCANEPRLKGSFARLALVYSEILYVLHAIVDRMDNMLQLRHEYGSGVLEELNAQVYPYRRNVAGSITLILFAVQEALTTKFPLPQFLPSARLAHLRMVNRVREVVLENGPGDPQKSSDVLRSEIELAMIKRVVRQKFQSWNAASAGQIEVIEYLEELVDLTKLLVGANEFRSGLLTRPTYHEYVERVERGVTGLDGTSEVLKVQKFDDEDEERDTMPEPEAKRKVPTKMRTGTFSKVAEAGKSKPTEKEEAEKLKQADEEELPRSLQRVRSRRVEELKLQKTRSVDEEAIKGKRVERGSDSGAT